MEQTEGNRIISSLTQRRLSILASYKRDAPVTVDRDTMLDLLELVVDLEHAQRATYRGATRSVRPHPPFAARLHAGDSANSGGASMDQTKGESTTARRDLWRWTPTIVSLVGALTICLAFGVPQLVSAAGGSGSIFNPVGPTRVLDTRTGLGGSGKVAAGGTVVVRGVSGARALAVNITVTEPDSAGFITAWPGGARPNSSAVNYEAGQTVANSAIVPTDPNGNFMLFTMTGAHLIVDVTGSFSEIPGGSAPITGAINATVTHYAPSFGSTEVSGTVVNGTNETITIAIDLQAASGESKTTFADDVAPGQTAAWDTFFSGEFTTGVSVLRAYKAF